MRVSDVNDAHAGQLGLGLETPLPEIVVNLWYVLCPETQLILELRARAYLGFGMDEQKEHTLRHAARHDHLIARHFEIPGRYSTVRARGEEQERLRAIPLVAMTMLGARMVFNEALASLRDELPNHDHLALGDDPIVGLTALVRDSQGLLHPQVSETGSLRALSGCSL